MPDEPVNSYDAFPYDTRAHYPTHPDCLGTLAALMGLTPAPPGRCRVLEIGCGTGDNLLPMAQTLPDSQFVGLDLSAVQIAAGQAVVAAVALTNVELRAGSIFDAEAVSGAFDYILCHGVYSWVPPPVQDAILAVCRRHLTPHGVAFVSYNTYPGWHGRMIVREALNYQFHNLPTPAAQVAAARSFVEFLATTTPEPNNWFGKLLRDEADIVRLTPDSYIYHEYLEEHNRPVYFHEFMAHAERHGLIYVGEAWNHPRTDEFKPEALAALQNAARDRTHFEQLLDFLSNRPFRRTVLCHAEAPLTREVSDAVFEGLHVSGLLQPPPEADAATDLSDAPVEYQRAGKVHLTTSHPLVKTALRILAEAAPESLSVPELRRRVDERLKARAELVPLLHQRLQAALMQCYLQHAVSLHIHSPAVSRDAGPKPCATPLARYQARKGMEYITSRRHEGKTLADFERQLLTQLDGSRGRAALTRLVADAAEPPVTFDVAAAHLEQGLQRLAEYGFFAKARP